MAIIPIVRTTVFILLTLFSLVVLGVCARIEYLLAGFSDTFTSFAPLGLAVSCLTILTLPVILWLSRLQQRFFTSMIIFEIVWFFLMWVFWVATASDAVVGGTYYFPTGCIYSDYPTTNEICYETIVVEAFAFLNFFCAFIYHDIVLLYAVINAIRGRSIWTASVKEATTGAPGAPMVQAQYGVPTYGAPAQPYNPAYPQQVPPQGALPAQPYGAYPQGIPAQYSTYPQQTPLPGSPANVAPGPNHNYPPSPPQQQINYAYSPSPTGNAAALPPQPNYNSHPTGGTQAPHPLPGGYQEQSAPQQPHLPSPYASH